MTRFLGLLLVLASLAFAQEKEDEGGISIDEVPEGPEEEPAKPAEKPKPVTAFPAREPGKKVATVEVKKKVYTFAVPEDWVLLEENSETSELEWELLLPGSKKRGSLWLMKRDGGGDPRSWPYHHAEWVKKEKPERSVEVRARPRPLAIDRHTLNDTDWVYGFVPLSVRGNQYLFQISCAAADFPQAESDLLATADSFKARVEIWPPIPTTYEKSEAGAWLIAKDPNVTASIAPLVKALKDAEKRFCREHGPLPKSDTPLVVLVHASRAQGAKLDPSVGERQDDFHAKVWERRLFAVPFPKENVDQAKDLAGAATDLLFVAKYGDWRPGWISAGERALASAEVRTGKPLPSLDEGYLGWYSTLKFHKISELEALREKDADGWYPEAFFYVAALREGKYRKQYQAFLADYAETADGPGAYERHVASINEDDLIEAANHYIATRIKEVKRKHDH